MSKYIPKGVWGHRKTRCAACGVDKPRTREHWGPDKRSSDGLSGGWCRKCITAWAKQRNLEIRTQALLAYSDGSPSCACCGECRYEFLALDHIGGGGNQHRLALTGTKKGGAKLYYWLRDNGYPKGFQVLCHNCNMAKGVYGQCPHRGESRPRRRVS